MGVYFSTTYSKSVQNASQTINQSYSGTCDITCENVTQNTNVTCIDCNIGGNVEVDQTCSANGNCVFNTNQQATADVVFKANEVASATPPAIWEKAIPGFDVQSATSISRQNITENINQAVTQSCNVGSVNQLNNTNIFLADTTVGGSILVNQAGSTQGTCALNSMMEANAYATGTTDNCSATGKKASKTCSGKGGKKIGSTLVWIVVGLAVIAILFIIAKVIGNKSKAKSAANAQRASATPQRAGVPPPPSNLGAAPRPPVGVPAGSQIVMTAQGPVAVLPRVSPASAVAQPAVGSIPRTSLPVTVSSNTPRRVSA